MPTNRPVASSVSLFILLVVPLLSGCVSTAEDLAAHLADRSLRHRHLFQLIEGDLALYRSCLHQRGGACEGGAGTPLPATAAGERSPVEPQPCDALRSSVGRLDAAHPARLAAATLSHPVLGQTAALHNAVGGFEPGAGVTLTSTEDDRGGETTLRLDLSVSQATDFMDRLHRTVAAGGWQALRQHTEEELAKTPAGSDEHARLARDHRRVRFIEKYVEAYFRNGRFIAVDFTIPAEEAQQDLAQELTRHSPEACSLFNQSGPASGGGGGSSAGSGDSTDCTALAQKLYADLRGSSASIDKHLVKVSQTGFTSRDGSFTAQLPELAITLDPLARSAVTVTAGGEAVKRLDFTAIGSDLARITLQAIFDAHEGLPAVPQATARLLGGDSLPLFSPPMGDVSTDDFNDMTRINQAAVVSTGVLLDRLIRGIGPLSLNNEALEELIVTLVTTSVGEAVAKASWCWYACNLDQDLARAEAEAETRLKEEGERLEGRVDAFAKRSVQRVRLDLRLQP